MYESMSTKDNIKIVYLFEPYPIFYQPYIQHVVRKMKMLNNIDFSIKAFVKNGEIDSNVEIFPSYFKRRLYKFFFSKPSYKRHLSYPELRLFKNDIVHVQHSFLILKLENLLKIDPLKRPKIVVTLRGSDTYVKPWKSKKWQQFYKNNANLVDAFIVMSSHQKIYLEKWGVTADKIHIIPISFGETFKINPKKSSKNILKVVSIFRMCWEKNIDGNLRVIKHLKEQGQKIQYDMYGDGHDREQALFLVDKYGLNDEVKIHGRVPNETLSKQLHEYDFYLQLSHSESLGMSVIEAQAHGIPAVVSNAGGLPEIVEHNITGFVVDSFDIEKAANDMIQLYNSNEDYLKYSEAAIQKAQSNYHIDLEMERLMTLYNSLK